MTVLSERFDEVLRFASIIHRGQTRKGSAAPFITHPLAVCALVGEHGGDEEQMIAALLHDALEHEGTTREEIQRRFGDRVAAMVEACTDWVPGTELSWRQQKERYLAQLHAAGTDVRLIAVIDKLHNLASILADLRAVGPKVWRRFSADPQEVCWYFRTAVETLRAGWQHPLLEDLERAVTELERYARSHRASHAPPT